MSEVGKGARVYRIFTDTGHIALACGLDSEGRIILNDPNSVYNSKNRWQYDKIKKEIKAAWAVEKNDKK